MHFLRNSKLFASFALVWFVLFLGTAIASSIVSPGNMQLVCSASGGMKLLDTSGDDGEVNYAASMDCPLCAAVHAPAPPTQAYYKKPSCLAHALQPVAAAHIASATAPPLPSRGPPASLL
jgi:hypothetical protein